MIQTLKEQDIRAILTGAAFYGAGGGNLKLALSILDSAIAKNGSFSVKLAEHTDLSHNSTAIAMTGIYTPEGIATKEVKFTKEAETAITSIQQSAYMAGKRIEAIFPMENTPVSIMVAMLAATASGLPILDGDGCGRGVPGIDVTLLEKGNIPFSPAVLSDDRGNVIRIFPYQATDAKAAENMCHYLCAAFGHVAALAAWLTPADEIADKLVIGSLNDAKKLGELFIGAENGAVACVQLEDTLPVKILTSGKVIEKDTTSIKLAAPDDKIYSADISAVTTHFRTETEILASCPALICALNAETGLPISNEEIEVGMEIRYYSLPVTEKWADFTACWKRYLS